LRDVIITHSVAIMQAVGGRFIGHTSDIDSYRIQWYLWKQGFFRTLSLDKNVLYFIYGDCLL